MSGRGTKTQSRFGNLENRDATDASEMDWFDEEESDADQLIGKVIDGRYKLLSLIGQGGMGSVYKAEHLGIRRLVALKLLHPSLASVPEVKSRFEREAFAIGRIEHPNCVNVSDFGTLAGGSLYLVMEFLEGHSLGDELADHKRIAPARALHILRHVLCGLGHAHDNDIVHRDVKPENVVLVTEDEDPDFAKILDFGIAKLMGSAAEDDGGVKLTQAGMAFGTPIYMSPEQAVGNPVDGRADLYAAAVMAYEMITGHPPFYSDDKIEVMSMHTTRPVPPMKESAPDLDVPTEIEQLILRGLAKRPNDRYVDAADFVAAVDTVLGGGSVPHVQSYMLDTGVSGGHAAGRAVALPMQTQGTQQLAELADALTRRGRRTRMLISAAFMIAAVVGIAIAIAASIGKDSDADDPSTLASRAEAHLRRGDPQAAIELLEKNEKKISENGAAQLQLGHAFALSREDMKALDAYRHAIELDRSAIDDGKLRANLSVMRDGDDAMASVMASDLLATRMDDQQARDKLVEFASTNKKPEVREKAVGLVMALGLSDRVDWVESHMLDLVQGENCTERRESVTKLRALGDKRAIPALKKAAYRQGRTGKWKGKKINSCLKQDALEAVEYLEILNSDAATPPTPVQPE